MRLLLLFPLLLVAGCSVLGPHSPERDALSAARARWAAAGAEAYTMTQVRTCFCPADASGPFRVTVRDGAVQSVTFEGEPVPAERALSVEALFRLVERALDAGAVTVDAQYDPSLGYPVRVYIDYNEQIADEEVGYTVTDFQRG